MADVEYLINPDGETVKVPVAEVPGALTIGYRPASSEQIKQRVDADNKSEKFGSVGQQILAGVEGACSAILPGIFPAAEQYLGIPTENIKAREELPAHTIGEIGGYGLGLLGGTTEAGALKFGAASALPAIEGSIAKKVLTALPEATSVVGKISREAAARGLGGAVAGSFAGLGTIANEAALGDPDLNGQRIAATVGMTALFGGAMSGLGTVAMEGTKGLVSKGEEAISKGVKNLREWYPGYIERTTGMPAETVEEYIAKAGSAFKNPQEQNKMMGDLGEAIADTANNLTKARTKFYEMARPAETAVLLKDIPSSVALSEAEKVIAGLDEGINKIFADKDRYLKGIGKDVKDIRDGLERRIIASDMDDSSMIFDELRKTRQALDEKAGYKKSGLKELPYREANSREVVRDLRTLIKQNITNPEAWGEAAVRQAAIDIAHSEFMVAMEGLSTRGLSALNSNIIRTIKTKSGEQYAARPQAMKAFFNQMSDIRGQSIRDALDDYFKAGQQLADQMKASYVHAPSASFNHEGLDAILRRAGDLSQQAQEQAHISGLKKQLTPAGSGSTATLGIGRGLGIGVGGQFIPGIKIAAGIYGLGDAGYNALKKLKNVPEVVAILSHLEGLGQKAGHHIDSMASAWARTADRAYTVGRTEIAVGLGRSFGKSTEDSTAEYERRIQAIQKMAQPDQMYAALDKQIDGLYEHAPKTSQSIQNTTVRAVQFLKSKIPQSPQAGPLAAKWTPSRNDISKFNRYYEAVYHPERIWKQLANGTASPEAIEAIQAVFPAYWQDGMSIVMLKVASMDPAKMTYQAKTMLSMALNKDMDGTRTAHMITSNQKALMGGAPQNAGSSPGPATHKLSSLTLSSRSLTASQASSQRK